MSEKSAEMSIYRIFDHTQLKLTYSSRLSEKMRPIRAKLKYVQLMKYNHPGSSLLQRSFQHRSSLERGITGIPPKNTPFLRIPPGPRIRGRSTNGGYS